MDLGLNGKRAIVTGGSRGIGKQCALALAREGVHVCIAARTEDVLNQTLAELEQTDGKGYAVAVDLTTQASCEKVVQETIDRFDGVDILINNVGAARNADILGLSPKLIDEALSLKTYSYLRMSQLVIPYMRKNQWGRIVNIAGSAGTSPTRGNIPTGTANITILNITRALSDAVAGDGILVNAVCPGLTNTGRARTQQGARAEREGRNVEALLQELGQELPAGRIAEPEEIANVVTFLASEACSYMFGSTLYMDGGKRRATP
ncbi:MAG: SDR family oxidoreductase [Candidatus Poribacteria bacterium]|nr:SDR family oxidoreductase [Candidatus Poribacteria bacterium]